MALIAAQKTTLAGTTWTYSAASAADSVVPNNTGSLHVKNGSGVSTTITIVDPGLTPFGQANPDLVITVGAGVEKTIGPFPATLANPATGNVDFTTSPTTSITVAYSTTA